MQLARSRPKKLAQIYKIFSYTKNCSDTIHPLLCFGFQALNKIELYNRWIIVQKGNKGSKICFEHIHRIFY